MVERQYGNETEDAILARKLARVSADLDKRQGSVIYDTLSPNAFEEAQLYNALDDVIAFGLNVTADTPNVFVDLKVKAQGMSRKLAVVATGSLTFSGINGTTIPVGTRARTDATDAVYFVTTSEGVIAGEVAVVNASAELGGISGNASSNSVTVLLGNLAGTVAVTNANNFTGGVDEETNQALLERYYEKVQRPATSGNVYQYEQWAKEVSGVGDAKVYPIWNGPGTVKLVLLDDLKTAPDASVITAASTYIEMVRPIGATVTVVGASELAINVSATLTLAQGATLEDVASEFAVGLTAYLQSVAFTDDLIRYTRIANVLLDISSVIDYADLLVNGATANIQPADEAVGVVGAVTFT